MHRVVYLTGETQMTTAITQNQEQLAWDMQCYGCTSQSLRKNLENTTMDYLDIVASMMSDAQEEIERDMNEEARQTLNRAKFVLFNYAMKEE
jgi:hypothetical protein